MRGIFDTPLRNTARFALLINFATVLNAGFVSIARCNARLELGQALLHALGSLLRLHWRGRPQKKQRRTQYGQKCNFPIEFAFQSVLHCVPSRAHLEPNLLAGE
jgi:hypothetical protein